LVRPATGSVQASLQLTIEERLDDFHSSVFSRLFQHPSPSPRREGNPTMKRVTLLKIAVCSALAIGCSSASSEQVKTPPKGRPPGTPVPIVVPETAITKLETSDEKVTYLHQLGKDASFDPSKHSEMLQKYAGDPDQQVASAAKELLDRVK
jgi:hypothetical protein